MLGRLSSCVGSLILILISVLLASNAYAQFSPTPFIDLEYFYDGVGNVESIIDHIDSQNNSTMQYDSLDRLTVADGPWGARSFAYDSIGNRTSKDINGQDITYTYGTSDNRLGGFSYDANGNVINDGTFTYTYDSENRLIQVTNGTDVITYGYDGDGRRISQTVNGETTIFAYGVGLNVLTEFTGSGVPKFDYIYAGNRNIARINFDGAGVPVSKEFYHPDHLGSTIGLTDQETTKVWDRTYLPYGGTFTGTGTTENTHQYTAKELEAATGLYYYGARYHNPSIGRFMSPDPAGADPTDPQSWNRYAYVLNNPIKYIDPDGSMECSVIPEGVETSPSGTCGAIGGGGGRQLALPPGPKQLALPKAPTERPKFIYDFRALRYRSTATGRFVSQRYLPYPPNRGFRFSTKGYVPKGTIIDRIGRPSGRYAGRIGATISERGIPQGSEYLEYHRYEVLKPISAEIGPAASVPEFGAVGGATQYLFDKSIETLVQQGFLKEIP
jgi:RHS repeat-associated protein